MEVAWFKCFWDWLGELSSPINGSEPEAEVRCVVVASTLAMTLDEGSGAEFFEAWAGRL